MKCPNCGHELADNVRFCVNCGSKIEAQKPQPAQQAQPAQTQQTAPRPAQPIQPAQQPMTAQAQEKPPVPELTLNQSPYRPQAPTQPQGASAPASPAASPAQPQQGSAAAGVGAAITAGVVGASAQQPQPVQQPQPAQQVQPAQRPQAQTYQQGYSQPQTPVQSYQPQQPAIPQSQDDMRSRPYGTGGWMLVQFLEGIPLVGFICQLVWAFGSGNISRRNYARARLIWLLIGIAIVVVLSIVFGASFSGIAQRISELVNQGYSTDQIINAILGK